ncbi:transport and Golgi organization protein 11 [Orussus abietinus]|uniref:transport and Golgi organization protein 11 n=1 Tax=Orussus abietinus TaxID=222816 RepID=UPI00062545E1|nr:transport and Golgi organization protein 11 [Orussus abietinus]XP_012284836.1 transport and Golgi organization protein 11 [Orussus abietinus]
MSKAHSPTRFNGEADNFYDSNFTLDISKRMRVPKSIRVNGDNMEDNVGNTNGTSWNQMLANEKFEMHVPDRILVVGQEKHVGTKAPPREILLENSVMSPEPGIIRVQTPPRVLTLDDHYFPAVDEDEPHSTRANESLVLESVESRPHVLYNSETQIARHVREQTPSYSALDVSLAPSEEIQHLRRQVGKLNRRVMAVELEMLQRQQREKILFALSLTYFLLKAFSWLTRN